MLAGGPRRGLEGALRFPFFARALLPVLLEQPVHQGGDFGDTLLAELAREQRGDVLDHAAALRFVDRLRVRPSRTSVPASLELLKADRRR